jgi:hypothetical protein
MLVVSIIIKIIKSHGTSLEKMVVLALFLLFGAFDELVMPIRHINKFRNLHAILQEYRGGDFGVSVALFLRLDVLNAHLLFVNLIDKHSFKIGISRTLFNCMSQFLAA